MCDSTPVQTTALRSALPLLAPNPRARGALGDQTDPLEPAGRRFGNFVFAIFPLGANDGARAFAANVADDVVAAAAAAPGARRVYQPRGHHGTRGTERSAVSSEVAPAWIAGRAADLLNVGRSADRRRSCRRAPRARGFGASKGNAVGNTICARQTCFCWLFRFAITALSRL